MSDSSPIRTIIVLESIGTKTKKRGNCTCLLVPRREALASPGSSETSNAEAHADMYIYHNYMAAMRTMPAVTYAVCINIPT